MTQTAGLLDTIPWISILAGLVGAALLWLAFRFFSKTGQAQRQLSNWRFSLLVITGIALSLASGWTTWEGMRNFTTAPLLSFLITFGIQAILLVVSWLIGESFANSASADPEGRSPSSPDGAKPALPLRTIGSAMIAICAFVLLLSSLKYTIEFPAIAADYLGQAAPLAWFGLIFGAILLVVAEAGTAFIERSVWALRIVFVNLTLWVMFAACLAASVFFSFDSLFSNIFPESERNRVAELHTRARVAQLNADVRDTAQARLARERNALLSDQTWRNYDAQLSTLSELSAKAPALIRANTAERLRERQTEISTLESDQAAASAVLDRLEREVQATQQSVTSLRRETAELDKTRASLTETINGLDKQIAAKRLEAEQEASGLGETGKAGRGPKYKEIDRSRRLLEFERRKAAAQAAVIEKQLDTSRQQLAGAEQRLLEISRRAAKQRADTQTASRLLSLSSPGSRNGTAGTPSAATVIDASSRLEQSRTAYIQTPTLEKLEELTRDCRNLTAALGNVTGLGSGTTRTDCASADLRAATAAVDARRASIATLNRTCTASGSMPETASIDSLVTFARDCIATAGLPASETAALQRAANRIALKRDDKAHRFVVTMNAFEDGNQLAFLALAIALAIDGLVFAAGLFGAYAARSPLSAIGTNHGKSGQQLEAVVASALLPDVATNARHVLEFATPATTGGHRLDTRGWTHVIDTTAVMPGARRVVAKLLAAGATVGAVHQVPGRPHHHALRRELVEFLALTARLSNPSATADDRAADLMSALVTSLSPGAEEKAAKIRRYFSPLPREDGFVAVVDLKDVEIDDRICMRLALTAGAAMDCVRDATAPSQADAQDRADGSAKPATEFAPADRFVVHKDMYQALTALHASHLARQEQAAREADRNAHTETVEVTSREQVISREEVPPREPAREPAVATILPDTSNRQPSAPAIAEQDTYVPRSEAQDRHVTPSELVTRIPAPQAPAAQTTPLYSAATQTPAAAMPYVAPSRPATEPTDPPEVTITTAATATTYASETASPQPPTTDATTTQAAPPATAVDVEARGQPNMETRPLPNANVPATVTIRSNRRPTASGQEFSSTTLQSSIPLPAGLKTQPKQKPERSASQPPQVILTGASRQPETPRSPAKPTAPAISPQHHLLAQLRGIVPMKRSMTLRQSACDAAEALWTVLDQATAASPQLHEVLWHRRTLAETRLAEACEALLEQAASRGQEAETRTIEQTYQRLSRGLPALLLQTDGGVLSELVDQMVSTQDPQANPALQQVLADAPVLELGDVEPWYALTERVTSLLQWDRQEDAARDHARSLELGLDIKELADLIDTPTNTEGGSKNRP